ncbi:hypothetical protein HDU92_009185 [Lobulomyces angularis]|nr:hypothetical protein HDU92_009185 [Lobulomyces angularis]
MNLSKNIKFLDNEKNTFLNDRTVIECYKMQGKVMLIVLLNIRDYSSFTQILTCLALHSLLPFSYDFEVVLTKSFYNLLCITIELTVANLNLNRLSAQPAVSENVSKSVKLLKKIFTKLLLTFPTSSAFRSSNMQPKNYPEYQKKLNHLESSAQPNFDFPEKSAHEIHEISNQRGDLTASIDSTTDLSIETIPSKIKEIKKNRKYKIIWRQRPIHGRMSGNVGTERRTVDPIPIIELLELKENGEFMPITEENIFTSMRASLYDAEGKTCLNNAQTNVSKDFPNILGDTVECSVILYDEFDRLGTFFVFKDLSVRSPGNYTIKFTLYDLESDVAPYGQLASKKSLINVLLAPITIYKPKDFPGTLNSSALTKAFKKQDQFFSNNDRHCVSTAQQHPQYQSNANNASEINEQNSVLVQSSRRKMNEGLIPERKKKYAVIWRQKPVHARMSGNGAKERRTIDPPPILELLEVINGKLVPIVQDNCFTHMRAALYTADGKKSLESLPRERSKNQAILVGDLIEYSRVLFDDLRRTGTFFVFKDLSIKRSGTYTIKFTLYDLESDTHRGQLASKKPFQFQIFSPPVKVLSPKDFPGMLESSNISRVFNNQGLKLTIKNKENN